ncbi:MAG: Oxidoreductase [Pleopsidium flavum]|nr:MAG: Oxidoreductase [Pleopsidium flavum]
MHNRSFLKLCFTLLLGVFLLATQVRTNPVERRDVSGVTGALEARDNFGSAVGLLERRAHKKFPPAKKGKCKHSRSVEHLTKRTDIVQLYDGIKGADKVPVGGTRWWNLDPKKHAAFSTAEFYGCTVVITVDGKGVIIGHYGEETGGSHSCLSAGLDFIDLDDHTAAYIINAASPDSVGYKAIVAHLKDYGMKDSRIHNYRYTASSGVGTFPGHPKGKAVVEWSPKEGGDGATLNVYIEKNTPKYTQNFDAQGNPYSIANPPQIQDDSTSLPTLEAITAERRQRSQALPSLSDTSSSATANATTITQDVSPTTDSEPLRTPQEYEDEADQQGAFNPETGEINWECPCLGGMAHGPCGEQFRAAFSCFVYSKEEPKGMDCIDRFKGMQDCFREHPDVYGSELDDDEEEQDEELIANAVPTESDGAPTSIPPPSSQPSDSKAPASRDDDVAKAAPKQVRKQRNPQSETDDLVPKAWHDGTKSGDEGQ